MAWTGQVPTLMNCYPSLPVCNVCPECDDVSADILRSSRRAAIAHTYITKIRLCSPPRPWILERSDFSLQLWPQTHHLGGARPLQHYHAHDKNFKRETQGFCPGLWKAQLVPISPLPLNTEISDMARALPSYPIPPGHRVHLVGTNE